MDAENQHLRNPPPEIVGEGAAAIVEYLKEMYQARVCLCVCGCVVCVFCVCVCVYFSKLRAFAGALVV